MTQNKLIILFCGFVLINSCTYSQQQPKLTSKVDSLTYQTTQLKNSMIHFHYDLSLFTRVYHSKWSFLNQGPLAIKARFKKHPRVQEKMLSLYKYTRKLLDEMQHMQGKFIKEVGGGVNRKGNTIVSPLVINKVHQYMITEKRAYKLEQKLNDYVVFINREFQQYNIPKIPLIANSNIENPLYTFQANRQKLDFAHAYFSDTTAIMALMYHQHFTNVIISYREGVVKYMLLNLVDKK